MGFRFSRRLKILPGVTLNLSKSGVSTTIGGRGARITFGRGRVRETVGLPGSGIAFSESQNLHGTVYRATPATKLPTSAATSSTGVAWRGWLWVAILVALAVAFAWSHPG